MQKKNDFHDYRGKNYGKSEQIFIKNNVENKKKYRYRYHEQYIKNSDLILRQEVFNNNHGNSDKIYEKINNNILEHNH